VRESVFFVAVSASVEFALFACLPWRGFWRGFRVIAMGPQSGSVL